MTPLRHPPFLGTDDEIRRLRGLLQTGPAVRHPDRPHLVVIPLTGTERGEVFHQNLEDEAALDRRGQHALDVFHDEGGGAQTVEHADVLSKEIMPLVLFRDVSDLPFGPRAPDERIGLAGRAADQDGVVALPAQRTDGMIDGGGSRFLTEF